MGCEVYDFRQGADGAHRHSPDGCYDVREMAEEQKPKQRKRYRHWSMFPKPSIPYEKLGKRVEAGLCIGCGKEPCECKLRPLRDVSAVVNLDNSDTGEVGPK